MDITIAKSIINEAIQGGFMEPGEWKNSPDEIKEAEYWVEEAKLSWKAGFNHPTVEAILYLADAGEAYKKQGSDPAPLPDDTNPVAHTYPRRSSGGFSESDQREADLDGLPIPQDFNEDPTLVPRDLTAVGDIELRRLHGEYQAYLSRVTWLVSTKTNELKSAEYLREDEYRKGYLTWKENKMIREEKSTQAELDLLARGGVEYKKLNKEVTRLEKELSELKALKEIYAGYVTVLSRDWTMRVEERK